MKLNSKTIVLTGGGTAGHVMPNINLQTELKKYFDKIIYIGSKTGIEKELVTKQTDYIFEEIDTVKFDRKNPLKNLSIPFKLSRAKKQAEALLKKYKPSIVFSKGGYVGLPVIMSASKLKIPAICHESDMTLGLANRLAKKYANKICTNFKITAEQNGKKCIHTSMPLKLSKLSKEEAKQKLGINTQKPVLLVTGGSLGAKVINNFIFQNIETLTQKYYVLHLTGKHNSNKNIIHKDYKQIEFSSDMWTIFKASTYALSRAGANTIVELLSNNILTIFVPLPKSVSRGDQIENAKLLSNNGLCKMIMQEDLAIEKTQKMLNSLEKDSKNIQNNIKNANFEDGTKNIINIILKEKST